MNALVILTQNPKVELIDFYRVIGRDNYDVYFIVDDNSNKLLINDLVNYIQIDDSVCERYGYHSFNNFINKNKNNTVCISAWDKALFYFSNLNKSYEYIWFVEDDVFVPNINLFETIDEAFLGADLLSSENVINTSGETESWIWWRSIPKEKFPLPWARSMVCVVRISRKLIKILDNFVKNNRESRKFIEFIFHTLAIHNDLIVNEIDNLKGVVFRKDWQKQELNNKTFYHPVKEINQQTEFRKYLSNDK